MNTNAGDLRLVGGRLCLDFVNTQNRPAPGEHKEHLRTYNDFIAWAVHCALINHADAAQLVAAANADPVQATHTLGAAHILRETLEHLLRATEEQRPRNEDDLRVLNATLAAAPQRSQLVSTLDGVAWENVAPLYTLDALLWPIVYSAADLLTSSDVTQVRTCGGAGCSWMFLDTTTKHSRQWCSMEDCGNRMKARRHYARKTNDDKMTE